MLKLTLRLTGYRFWWSLVDISAIAPYALPARCVKLSGPSAHVLLLRDLVGLRGHCHQDDRIRWTIGHGDDHYRTYGDNYKKLKERKVSNMLMYVFFIDHDKKLYKSDLMVIEQSGLLRSGSVVVADNVVYAHISDYLDYVRGHPHFKSVLRESLLEYSDLKDAIEVSTYVE
ncbi:S-adenosyl-L-methionine-dependent methyltransferase [Phytophthora cactorum]|nr:S-adenosyl-L-methionine-dependent methyltransferase [Phytophthora cactorum]